MSKGKRPAFSVVELMVVMGLISVLMAMLLPALAASRETAKMVQCQSNLRQIGQALFEYANVYQGKLPLWSGWNVYPDGSSPEDDPGLAWTEELAFTFDQTPLSRVYDCPAFPPDVPMNYFLEARWSHLHGRHNIKMTEVRLSSEYIMGGESTAPGGYIPPFGDAPYTTVDVDKSDEGFIHMAFAGLCLKTLTPHDGSESLWPLGALAKTGSVDPLSRGNNADEAILSRLRWAGFDPPASLSPLDGSSEPDFGATPRSRIESGPSWGLRVFRQSPTPAG